MKSRIKPIIEKLLAAGASYADVRVHISDESESFHTMNGKLKSYDLKNKVGFGLRVLAHGSWGFASSENLDELEVAGFAALSQAKAASALCQHPVSLAPKAIFKENWSTPNEIDPFTISSADKVARLFEVENKLKDKRFEYYGTYADFYRRSIYYLDSEGTETERNIIDVNAGMYCHAKDKDNSNQRRFYNMYQDANGTTGWENLLSPRFDRAEKTREELLSVLDAPECKEEVCDAILLSEMMALQTHETIGHALELDRILGYELSYAGGSHVDLDDFGKLQFGSEKLNARADGTVPNSPGSTGFDDDGVKGRNVLMIEKGKLKNAITSRQMIIEANQKAGREIFENSGGACRAESYNKMPIERMNNINIDPGNDGNLDDLVSSMENGIILEGPRSWSIGSNRENFHFACEIGWKVKDGKIDHVVRNPTYWGDSLPFWHSLKKVGNKETWQMQQVFMCGKGQPNQIMRLGHGIPICVFGNVNVGNK